MSPFLKASAYALQQMPVINAVIDDKEIVYRDYVDISVAVSTPKVRGFLVQICWLPASGTPLKSCGNILRFAGFGGSCFAER